MVVEEQYAGGMTSTPFDDSDLMGVYEEIDDELADLLEGMDDETILDDLENYPEIMGAFYPEIMGKRRGRLKRRIRARRKRKLQRRIAKMSPKKRIRFMRRLKRRKKRRKRLSKIFSIMIPGAGIARAIAARRRYKRTGKRGKLGQRIAARRARRIKRRVARGSRRRGGRPVPVATRKQPGVSPMPMATRSVRPDPVPTQYRESVPSDIEPDIDEFSEETRNQVPKKKGMDMKIMLPIAAAALAIPFLLGR